MISPKTQNIISEDDYKEVKNDLTQKKKPSKILRILMNSMETYRQNKKMGWSRPWNKYNLVNFQVFKLDWKKDAYLLEHVSDILDLQFPELPSKSKDFCNDLLSDRSNLMGFVFVHDFDDNGKKYEGVNLSLGRINNKKYRDRLDIILESPIGNGKSQGLKRVRLYVDPYEQNTKDPLYKTASIEPNEVSKNLFSMLTDLSWDNDEKKLWNHWTVNYIDYFGDRQWILDSSFFYSKHKKTSRLTVNPLQRHEVCF